MEMRHICSSFLSYSRHSRCLVSVRPSFHFCIFVSARPPPVYQKAEPKGELFPARCYAPLGLSTFLGRKLQEEGKDLKASIKLYLEKNG